MTAQAPQWIINSFVRSAKKIGATASDEEIMKAAFRLIDRLDCSDRAYHTLNHVIFTISKLDELTDTTHHPDCVRIAAWYHACVFNPNKQPIYSLENGENESESAKIAISELSALGVDMDICQRISDMITGIKCLRNCKEVDVDMQVLHDAVIAILGTTPQEFKAFVELVRKVHSNLPILDYLTSMRKAISQLLDLPKIFISPMGSSWELPARQNLEAELVRIDNEIRHIEQETGQIAKLDVQTYAQNFMSGEHNLSNASTEKASDTVLIKRVSIADKLSQVQKKVDDEILATSANLKTVSTGTQTKTKIKDITSSMEMVEDCLETGENTKVISSDFDVQGDED